MDEKKKLRIWAKNLRKSLDMKVISCELAAQLREENYYKNARNILIFHPLEGEIDLKCLLNDDKTFYLPRVEEENLAICPYCIGDKLEISKFNVHEPCSAPIETEIIDLVIVPALAVDKNNHRLGYGGGFYDKFLSLNPHITSVVLLPKELCIDKLPIEKHDIQINHILLHG